MTLEPPAAGLGRHGLALAALILALLPLIGSDAVWSADVGAQLHQSSHLLDGTGWTSRHPLPQADPQGHYYGLHLAQRPTLAAGDPHRYVTLAKHPFLTWTVAGLLSVGGFGLVLVLSAVGTIASAVAAARITALFRPDLALWSLWITGLLSPLFFDAYIGYAHTVAAAAAAWAAFFALRSTAAEQARRHRASAAILIGLACLARTEGAPAAIALSMAMASLAVPVRILAKAGVEAEQTSLTSEPSAVRPTPRRQREALKTSAWLLAGAVIAVATDRAVAMDVTGPANPAWRPTSPGFLVGRWLGFAQTWLNPGRSPADLLIVAAAIALLCMAFTAGRRQGEQALFHSRPWIPPAAGALAVLAIAIRAVMGDSVMVSGLLFACPLLVAGLLLVRPAHLSSGPNRVCLVAFGLYALAVIATQYTYGGVAEWGGRYFAAGIPLGVVAVVVPLSEAVQRLTKAARRPTVTLFVAAGLCLNLLGLYSLHGVRQSTAELVAEIETATVDVSSGSPAPVVVSTVPLAGRVSWAIYDETRWLLVDSAELSELAKGLQRANVSEFALVSFTPDSDVAALEGLYQPGTNNASALDNQSREDASRLVPGDAVVIMQSTNPAGR